MPNPVESLHDEHVQLQRLLDLLESCLRADLKGGAGRQASSLMDCLVRFPEQFHHPVEDLLFERMLAHDESLAPLLHELNADHEKLARLGEDLARLLVRVSDADEERLASIRSLGMDYIDTLRTHMEIEETDMFPLADGLLQIDDWEFVEAGTERLRAAGLDTLAAAYHQKFGGQCPL